MQILPQFDASRKSCTACVAIAPIFRDCHENPVYSDEDGGGLQWFELSPKPSAIFISLLRQRREFEKIPRRYEQHPGSSHVLK